MASEARAGGAAVLERLEQDHQHLSRVMDVFDAQLAKLGRDDEDVDWNLMGEIIAYVQEYPDAVHHPLEDQLFDKVLDKGLTPAERELVHFNLSQHAQIISSTQRLADEIGDILNDIVVPMAAVREHGRRYLEMQRNHMHNEHRHLFPLAKRLLSDDDWTDVAQVLIEQQDPLFKLQLGRYEALYRHVAD